MEFNADHFICLSEFVLGMVTHLGCYRPFPPLMPGSNVAPGIMVDTSVLFHFEEEV